MQDLPRKQMTIRLQEALFQYVKIGLKWICGEISFNDVVKNMGAPEFHDDQLGKIEYAWFPEKMMSVSFVFNAPDSVSAKPYVSEFNIEIEDDVITNIPYGRFDELGVRHIIRGERIDGGRIEQSDFVGFPYFFDLSGSTPNNTVVFGYRMPLESDSPYDVEANVRYLAELISEKGPWNVSNVRKAVDLREVEIVRHYLTPEELNERKEANRRTKP